MKWKTCCYLVNMGPIQCTKFSLVSDSTKMYLINHIYTYLTDAWPCLGYNRSPGPLRGVQGTDSGMHRPVLTANASCWQTSVRSGG